MDAESTLALLRIEFPDGTEEVVPIHQSPFTIGRAVDSDVQLTDHKVSRRHARLLFEDEHVHLIDLKSSNGTFVGQTRLTPNEPYAISFDEVFRIGPYALRLEPAPTEKGVASPDHDVVIDSTEALEQLSVSEPAHEAEAGAAEERTPPSEREREVEVGTAEAPAPPESEPDPRVLIGVAEAPPPPPPPSEPPPPEDGRPSFDDAFGLPSERSRYLQYLPPIYDEHPFLGRFLLALEGVMAPVEQTVDHFYLYLDPHTTPAFFLDQLASWVGMTLDEKWPLEKRRAVVAEAAELYRRRGTRWSLSRHLAIYAGIPLDDDQISEWIQIDEPEDRPHHFHVVLQLPNGQTVDRRIVERIIQANKPAHTTYTLKIVEEKQ